MRCKLNTRGGQVPEQTCDNMWGWGGQVPEQTCDKNRGFSPGQVPGGKVPER